MHFLTLILLFVDDYFDFYLKHSLLIYLNKHQRFLRFEDYLLRILQIPLILFKRFLIPMLERNQSK